MHRIQAYMEKATREAKQHTSWINPEPEYDAAIQRFVEAVLMPGPENSFIDDVERFVSRISRAGLLNSLSQTVLKFMCPGVPDVYQGTEVWDFSLVDPDNRRPVDFSQRQALLATLPLDQDDHREWLTTADELLADGRLKLFVTSCLARLLRKDQDFFRHASYIGLTVEGDHEDNVVAYARCCGERMVVVVVGRLFMALCKDGRLPIGQETWGAARTRLPENAPAGEFADVFSGNLVKVGECGKRYVIPVAETLSSLPIAVLVQSLQRVGQNTYLRRA